MLGLSSLSSGRVPRSAQPRIRQRQTPSAQPRPGRAWPPLEVDHRLRIWQQTLSAETLDLPHQPYRPVDLGPLFDGHRSQGDPQVCPRFLVCATYVWAMCCVRTLLSRPLPTTSQSSSSSIFPGSLVDTLTGSFTSSGVGTKTSA